MIGATTAFIALVSGGIGGVVASAFMEAYFGRRAAEEVGAYDAVDTPHSAYYDDQGNWHPPSTSPYRRRSH